VICGVRCSPLVLVAAFVVIVGALLFFFVERHNENRLSPAPAVVKTAR
jgi:hypothetical protein